MQHRSEYITDETLRPSDLPSNHPRFVSDVDLSNGEQVYIFSVGEEDCDDISLMLTKNFTQAASYKKRSAEQINHFIAANTPEETWKTCSNPENICALVVKNSKGEVIGYRVMRRGVHTDTGEPVAEGKRLHVSLEYAGKGLGTALMEISEVFALKAGLNIMIANSSGSKQFFLNFGFEDVKEFDNKRFSDPAGATTFFYLQKVLTQK